MGRASKLSSFPNKIHNLAYSIRNEPKRIPCGSPEAARRFRFRLYDFRRALKESMQEASFKDFMDAVLTIDGDVLVISPPGAEEAWMSTILDGVLPEEGVLAPTIHVPLTAAPTQMFMAPPSEPKVADPFAAYYGVPERPLEPPVDPFDLTETRAKVDSFASAVSAWLGAGQPEK